jgi:hypothetical protein
MRFVVIVVTLALLSCSKPAAPEPVDSAGDATESAPYWMGKHVRVHAQKFAPTPPKGHPNDLADQVCKKAVALGCPQGDGCATMLRDHGGLEDGGDPLEVTRLLSVLQGAKNKRHIRDSTVLPCDAGRDEDWDGDGEAPVSMRWKSFSSGDAGRR